MNVHDFSGSKSSRNPRRFWPTGGEEETTSADRARAMVDSAKAIESSPAEMLRQDLNLLYGSMYEGRQLTSLYQYGSNATIAGAAGVASSATGDVTWNVIRSVIQTVASQVSRSRPRARFVTTAGNYKQKRKSRKLTQLCDGLFHMCRVYEKTQQGFILGGTFDCCGIEVARDGDVPSVSLVFPQEIMVDANDGIYGSPRSMYRRKFVDKDVLLAKFGKLVGTKIEGKATDEKTQAILDANPATPIMDGAATNLVEVYEAWHLPSGKGAKDGRHMIALDSTGPALVDEEYTRDYFPIILFGLDPALAGPYFKSAADVLMGIQMSVNTALDKIARYQHLACVPRVAVPMSAKMGEVTNTSVIRFHGTQSPTFLTPPALAPEVYEQLERHFERAFALYGVNAQIAAGQKEAGVTAAVAIRESLDIQTARFAVLSQRWEQLHMDIARRLVDIAREIYEDNKAMQVSAPGTDFLETIEWKEIDLKEDEYVIQPYPTSLLPQTPQGRLDRVVDLVSQGIWTPKRAEAALDDLDPDSHMDAQRAAEKNIERMCDDMLYDGKYQGPEPDMDLSAALRIASEYLNEGRNAVGTPEKHLEQLYKFLDDVTALQAMIAPPPQQAPAMQAPAPMPGSAVPAPVPG